MILILEIYIFLLHIGMRPAIFKVVKIFDLMQLFSRGCEEKVVLILARVKC